MDLLDIFIAPRRLYTRLNERPNWLAPFVVAVLIGLLSTLLLMPVMEHLALSKLPQGLSLGAQQRLLVTLKNSKYASLLLVPLAILLKLCITAFLLFAIALLMGAEASYRKTLSVVAYASIIAALEILIAVIIIYVRGVQAIESPDHLRSLVLGPSLFLNISGRPVMHAVLDSINIISIWYYALLTIGISLTSRLSRIKSAMAVGIVWLLQAGFISLLTALSMRFAAAAN